MNSLLLKRVVIFSISIMLISCASAANAPIKEQISINSQTKVSDFESNAEALDVVDDINYASLKEYINNKTYSAVNFDFNYGNLLSESKEITYTSKQLMRFYRAQLCKNVYWYNCKNNINNLLEYTGINIESKTDFITNNVESVIGYKVKYTTLDLAGESHQVSGSVLMPVSQGKLRGVVIVYHHTVLDKHNVPSNFKKDFFNQSEMLAATMATSGYVVVMPDYIGLGDDESSVHPYILYPEINAISGIYMLKLIPQLNESLNYSLINRKVPLYISGYSEGASYALWATKILQDNSKILSNYGYILRRSAPISGAYNISKVTLNSLMNSGESELSMQDRMVQRMIRPGLTANVLTSYNSYGLHGVENEVFPIKFSNCAESKTCVSQIVQESGTEFDKYNKLYKLAKNTSYLESGDSVVPLINNQLLEPNNVFLKQAVAADIYNWQSSIPVNLITLQNDIVVNQLNSFTAYVAMSTANSQQVNLTIIPNDNFFAGGFIPFTDIVVNHSSFTPYGYLLARKYFDEENGKQNHD